MKVGVIGCGGMGIHHAEELRKLEIVTDLVCCDLGEKQRAEASAKGFAVTATARELLAGGIDAAIVVTPPAAHASNITDCFNAGIPVLTEKPLATTIDESRQLVELAAASKLNFQVGFELRYCGMTKGMREIVDSGQIGAPLHMALIQVSGAKSKPGYMTMARTGGIFYEKLCHQVDIFRHWFGEPESIMAVSGPNAIGHYEVADNVLACMKFSGGHTSQITFTTTRAANTGGGPDKDPKIDHDVRGHYYQLVLTCSEGSVSYDGWSSRLEVVRYNHRDDNKSELIESIDVRPRWGEPGYAIAEQDGDFLERVAAGEPPTHPASDALESMIWVAKAEESLASGGAWIAAG